MAELFVDTTRGSNGVGTQFDPLNAMPATWTADTYRIKRGTTVLIESAPTINNGCVIDSYGDENAPMARILCQVGTTTDPIRINSGTLEMRNVWVQGQVGYNRNLVVSGGSTTSLVILRNCLVSDNLRGGGNGVIGYNAGGALELYDTTVTRTNGDNVNASGTLIMERCTLSAPGLDAATANGDNVQFSSASSGASSGSRISYSVLDRRGSQVTNEKQCCINQDAGSTGFIFEYNECIGAPSPEISGLTYFSVPGAIVRGNKFIGGTYGINVDASMEIYGNVFDGQTVVGLRLLDATGSEVIDFYNNTMVNQAICVQRPTSGSATFNNTNNIYFGYTTLYANSGGSISSSNIFTDNPLLDPRYRPTNLRVFDGGTNLGGTDLYGNAFLASPSIGAVQMPPVGFTRMLKSWEAKGNAEDFHGR